MNDEKIIPLRQYPFYCNCKNIFINNRSEDEFDQCMKDVDSVEKISEKRADLLLKAEAKIEKLSATEALIKAEKPYHEWLKPLEEIYFKNLISIMNNNQSKTSEMAGLNRGTTRKKLKQYNLIQRDESI